MTGNKARIFIVTGTSSSGKDSAIGEIKKKRADYSYVVTTTTRPMRSSEKQGEPYYFVSHDEFLANIKEEKMAEFATVYGNYYGSTKSEVEEKLKLGKPVIWKVDPQGATAIKKLYPDSISIFVKAPDLETLERWIRGRGEDGPEVVEERLSIAQKELEDLNVYDHIVINSEGKLEATADEIMGIIASYEQSSQKS